MDDRVDSQGLKSLSLEKDTELEDGDDGDEDEATNLKGAETGHVQTDSSECWNDVGSALPPSPFRGEPLRGGMPAGQRKLTRSSSLAPFTQKTVEGAVVNISSVTDKLRSLGLMLDPESIQYTSASEVLGKGAMGVIYKATLARPGSAQTVVAVKQMLREEDGGSFTKQELLDAALHEMIMGCKIRAHPSIINFVGAAQHTAGLLTVYELIDGPNMENYFQWQRSKASSWRPKLKHALRYGQQLFEALQALHTDEIVHRDVKPGNLMLKSRKENGKQYFDVKLIDFGLARECDEGRVALGVGRHLGDEGDADVCMTSKTGTYRYMAPEVFQGVPDYGCKVDVYSATMTLFYIVTGELPFVKVPPEIIAQFATQGQRPPLTEIDHAVTGLPKMFAVGIRGIIEAGWRGNAAERLGSGEAAERLASLGQELAQSRAQTLTGFHFRTRVKEAMPFAT